MCDCEYGCDICDPKGLKICFECGKKAEFILNEDVCLCPKHAQEETEYDLW